MDEDKKFTIKGKFFNYTIATYGEMCGDCDFLDIEPGDRTMCSFYHQCLHMNGDWIRCKDCQEEYEDKR